MEGGLLIRAYFRTYFLAGRATRISRDSVLAMANRASRTVAWSCRRTASLASAMNPLCWLMAFRGRRTQKWMLEISTAEQRRIGHILHDGIGQILSGVAFMGRALQRRLATGPLDASLRSAAADAAQIAEIAEKGMDQTRSMARVLDPAGLEAGGLASMLEEMASDIEKVFGVTCTFEHDGRVSISDEVVATHLYCIALEAATNAIRHGEAKRVAIRLAAHDPGERECAASSERSRGPDHAASSGRSRGPDQAALTVQDDGIGFEMAETTAPEPQSVSRSGPDAAKGMGLRIMNHRAKTIGGELTIRRRAEGGTLVVCAFPNAGRKR